MKKDKRPYIIGFVLIIIGIVILLSNIDFLPRNIHHYIFRWESFLILIGLLMIIVRGKIFSGMSVLAVGAYFLADDLFILSDEWQIWFWPAVLILMGISYIIKPDECSSICGDRKKDKNDY
ncbi:MAG: putative membrane protein [Ancylomarina sp.]|jgi:predicted membrane protein